MPRDTEVGAAVPVADLAGLYLVGESLGMSAGKPYEAKDGTTRTPFKVKVLVGDVVYVVEYQTEADARAAVLGGTVDANGGRPLVKLGVRWSKHPVTASVFWRGIGLGA